MKLPFVSALVLAAAILSAQLYPSHLGLVQQASFRLGDPAIKFELKLDDAQKAKIGSILNEHSQKQTDLAKQMTAKSTPEQLQKIQNLQEALDKSTSTKLIGALSASQKTRLRQLAIQENGAFALRDAGVAKDVGLSPEQKTKLEQIAQNTVKAMDDLNATASDEAMKAPAAKRVALFKKYEPKLKALEDEGKAKVLALLSAPQKAKWKTVVGKPFGK